MSAVLGLHRRVLELSQQWQKGVPTFQVFIDSHVGVRSSVNGFLVNQALSEFLNLIFHVHGINGTPFHLQVILKGSLTHLNVLPKLGNRHNIIIDLFQEFVAPIQFVGEIKDIHLLFELTNLLLEALDFGLHVL